MEIDEQRANSGDWWCPDWRWSRWQKIETGFLLFRAPLRNLPFHFVTAFQASHHHSLAFKNCRMFANAFIQVKSRQISHSSHPKTVINRQLQSQKRGLTIALTRADANYRVRKSRALKKLHECREWNTLPDATKYTMEEDLLKELASERDAKKEKLESEWLKKHEMDSIDDDEDDGWIMETGETEECDDDDDKSRGSADLTILDEEDEEWHGIQSDNDDDDDAVSDSDKDMESFIRDVAEIKRKSGEGWIEKMQRIEEKARKKAEKDTMPF